MDLIYLDPPFNSKAAYNILFRTPDNVDSPSQITAFEDTWHWTNESEMAYDQLLSSGGKIVSVIRGLREAIGENDIMAYLVMMAVRLVRLHKVLKETGSLYLHCDPTASHYLKIILDAIFNVKNFRNEIVWCYYGASSPGQRQFSRKHDIILWYSKSSEWTFNADDIRIPYKDSTLKRAKTTSTSIFHGKRTKRTLHSAGKIPEDYWNIPAIVSTSKERMGYPTQKPLALLERIIKASSNKGDIVLDPFCGCGTTVHASQQLGRNWIGIDITHLAVSLIEKRMKDAFGVKIKVEGIPTSLESAQELARRNKFQFEAWAVTLVPNVLPNEKQVGDRGVDGVGYISLGKDSSGKRRDAKIIVSVKGGENLTPSMIRDLVGTIKSEGAEFGVFICLKNPTKKAKEAAAKAGLYKTDLGVSYNRLQIYTVSDYFNGVTLKLPTLIDFVKAPRSKIDDGIDQTTL